MTAWPCLRICGTPPDCVKALVSWPIPAASHTFSPSVVISPFCWSLIKKRRRWCFRSTYCSFSYSAGISYHGLNSGVPWLCRWASLTTEVQPFNPRSASSSTCLCLDVLLGPQKWSGQYTRLHRLRNISRTSNKRCSLKIPRRNPCWWLNHVKSPNFHG